MFQTRKTSRGYEFECQHGSAECFGNKVHACAIDKVGDELTSLKLVSCMMEDSGNIEGVGHEVSLLIFPTLRKFTLGLFDFKIKSTTSCTCTTRVNLQFMCQLI